MDRRPPAGSAAVAREAAARAAADALYVGDHAARALGIDVLEVTPGGARLAMTVRGDMVNGHGVCHGGFLFALADTAFAYACNSAGVAMVAAGASIEFLAAAAAGERLIAVATESWRNERQGIYDVAVSTESGAARAHFRGRCARLRSGAAGAASATKGS
jgi:acyl-CoA thioesterase